MVKNRIFPKTFLKILEFPSQNFGFQYIYIENFNISENKIISVESCQGTIVCILVLDIVP
jgi:hypothetical protein